MLKLSVVTPVRKILVDEAVDQVFISAHGGELNILPGHAPLMTSLSVGEIHYSKDGKKQRIAISWGYCEVVGEEVSVLAETAEAADEIDLKRAEEALKNAKEKLDQAGLGGNELEKYLLKIQRAEARLNVAKNNQ